jgi:enoyl-CoA hydratase/carnithine racemase
MTVTLARPERRNAMSAGTWRTLARIGDALPDGVRIVVLRGDGPSFSAGIDLRMFSPEGVPGEEPMVGPGTKPEELERDIDVLQRGYTWLRRPEIVSIAVVQGHAIGAGFQLALACDLRVVADDVKFCMKEPALGLVPDLTGTKPLVDIVGLPKAIELCLTARTVPADEARELGIAQRVVAVEELDTALGELTTALLEVNAKAAVATKRLLMQARLNTLDQQRAAERREEVPLILGTPPPP